MTPSARRTLLEGVLLTLDGSGGGVSNAVALGRALLAGEDRAPLARAPRASETEIAEVRDKIRAELAEGFRVHMGMGVHPPVPWNEGHHHRGPGGQFSPGQQVMTSRGPAEVIGREFDMLRVKHRDGSEGLHPISAVQHHMGMAEAELAESKLSAAERKALPKSAFVFPEDRRYPIHDIGHARNALSRSSGKPEEAKVHAAVFKRYPGLKKKVAEAACVADFPSMMMPDGSKKKVKKKKKLVEAKDSMMKASTPEPFSTSKTSNWVARSGGLPAYIQHIAHDIHEKRGKSVSQAIQIAIGVVKRWAKGVGNVDAGTRAAAAKAVAEWEALKAKNAGKKAAKTAKSLAEAAYFDPIIALERGAEELAESLDVELLEECARLLNEVG